jgi:uncharacterized membrane protein
VAKVYFFFGSSKKVPAVKSDIMYKTLYTLTFDQGIILKAQRTNTIFFSFFRQFFSTIFFFTINIKNISNRISYWVTAAAVVLSSSGVGAGSAADSSGRADSGGGLLGHRSEVILVPLCIQPWWVKRTIRTVKTVKTIKTDAWQGTIGTIQTRTHCTSAIIIAITVTVTVVVVCGA